MSTVTLDNKTILVTGAAGFIGSNLVKRIYQEVPSATVIGIDNMNAYYDVALKEFRLNELAKYPTFTFVKGNIADKELITKLFEKYKPSVVVNLAAQAGVRYSITNPDAYVESNLVGFFNILEACRHSYDDGQTGVEHLVYASSSSVYGSNKKVPYSTDDKVDNPVSLYAATKKSNEYYLKLVSSIFHVEDTFLLSQFSKIVPIKTAYLRYAVCGCCLCIKNANYYKYIPCHYAAAYSLHHEVLLRTQLLHDLLHLILARIQR